MFSSVSKRKTRRNNRAYETEISPRREIRGCESLNDQDFEDITNKIERNLAKRLNEESNTQNMLFKMVK